METNPMTLNGKLMLENELKQLITVDRPAVIAAIATARAHGDLSENADYSAAKERQGFIEGRIQDITSKLSRAEVIDPTKVNTDRVIFGAHVTLLDIEEDKTVKYQIVGVDEADIKGGKIGISSPIARALIGKRKGDDVQVNAPKGVIEYQIVSIEYK
jgi:transcription elongation factor GreA